MTCAAMLSKAYHWYPALLAYAIPLLHSKHIRGLAMRFSLCSQLGNINKVHFEPFFHVYCHTAQSVSPQTFTWLISQPAHKQVHGVWLVSALPSILGFSHVQVAQVKKLSQDIEIL